MKYLAFNWLVITASCLLFVISGCGGSGDDNSSSSSDSSNTTCLKLAIDSADNIYISGYTHSSLDSETKIGESDVFLVKYANDGTHTWSKLIGTTDYEYMQDMTVTTADQTLIAGYTYGTLDNNSSSGDVDMMLVKVAADGSDLWEKQFGTSERDYAFGIATDATGDIFIAGHTYGSFQGALSGTKDFVMVKLDSAGTQIWVRQVSNDEGDNKSAVYGVYGIGVGLDGAGNAYAVGFTTGNLPGNTSSGEYDLFVTKYDSSGNRLWIQQFGSSEDDFARDIEVTTAGDVYITGYTDGALDDQTTNAGEYDLFLAKLDTDGNIDWIRQTGTDYSEYGNGITLDSSGNVFLTGYSNGDLEGSNIGGSDLIIMKYDATGDLKWTKQLGTDLTELSRAIETDSADNLYITGYTYGKLDGEKNSDEDYYSYLSRYSAAGVQVWTTLF